MEKRIYISAAGHGPNVRNYLTQIGTRQDLERYEIRLADGLRLKFYSDDASDDGTPDDLLFEGTVHFDSERGAWYALLDENSFRHRSDKSEDDR